MFTQQTFARSVAGAVGVIGLLVLSAGCGGSDGSDGSDGSKASDSGDSGDKGSDDSAFLKKSAQEIADASTAALKGLDTVHFAGAITSDGQDITLDIQLNTDGDCEGTFGTGGGTAEILSVGGATYFRPDEAFWKLTAGDAADKIIATVGDKYVAVDSADDSFSSICDLDQLLDNSSDSTTYTKGDTSEIDGNQVIAINRSNTSDGDSTGYVQTGGEHYLVKLEKSGADQGTVTFDEFNEKFTVTAPAADETIAQADLG